jgi:UDP-GlcNAc:undecaprenyl-phosphate/decaprenyl-phosphate GlcNAc-1-phosphate transferase
MIFLSILLLAVLITISMMPALSMLAIRCNIAVDLPGERKVHTRAVPRIGGVAMACGAILPLLYWFHADRFVIVFLTGATTLVIFGLLDDMYDLSPKTKLVGQILAALIVIIGGGVQIRNLGSLLPDNTELSYMVSLPLTLLAIVGATNAINLSDGLDGLAGGICMLIFATLGFLAYLEGSQTIGLISLALVGALFGFLRFNTHPASVFMGDAGSQFLGFSAATLAIALTQGAPTLSPVLPLILLGFPILDTLTVMVTRIVQGRSPFSADKKHFHHHLLGLGFHHAESVLVIYVLQAVLVIAALLLRYFSDWLVLTGYLGFSAAVLLFFDRSRKKTWQPRRFDLFETRIAGRLRILKREGIMIKKVFPVFVVGIPLLLVVTCLAAHDVPPYLSIAAMLLLIIIGLTWVIGKRWLGWVLRGTLYLLIPFAVYLSETYPTSWLKNDVAHDGFNILFGAFSVLILIISKFSRRNNGFKSSPMDFLIIILAVAVPNLPDQHIQEYQFGLVAAKIIMLYFSFEVLMAEMRGKYNLITASTMVSLLVLASHSI